jgi:predicted nucleic acid-binding protein
VIFVDTSFWAALTFPGDEHHAHARGLLSHHGNEPLLTSNQVVGETWTLFRRRIGHRSAVQFLDGLERTARISVARVSKELESEALRWLRRHDEREYSLVDATSFALMRSFEIREAFAFDSDFSAAGFVELR